MTTRGRHASPVRSGRSTRAQVRSRFPTIVRANGRVRSRSPTTARPNDRVRSRFPTVVMYRPCAGKRTPSPCRRQGCRRSVAAGCRAGSGCWPCSMTTSTPGTTRELCRSRGSPRAKNAARDNRWPHRPPARPVEPRCFHANHHGTPVRQPALLSQPRYSASAGISVHTAKRPASQRRPRSAGEAMYPIRADAATTCGLAR